MKSSHTTTRICFVAYIPGVVFRSDTALFKNLTLPMLGSRPRAALGVRTTYIGPRALPFGQRSDAVFTVDSSATLSFSQFELGLTVTNLLGSQYRLGEYNFASDFHSYNAASSPARSQPTLVPERTFTAGPPRAIFGSFAINFGGAS